MASSRRNCTRCGELLPEEEFYFVSKKLGTRRGQCKNCMREVKREQREPDWRPTCSRCGQERERVGPGRRLCERCFGAIYDEEDRRENGAHRLKLNNCRICGTKRLRADHMPGSALCPVCRSVPAGRRTQLKTKYNLAPREYLLLLEVQGDRCAICKRKRNKKKGLHIDHSHADPRIVRGAICNVCNTMLGMARDRAGVLRAAAEYLETPPAQEIFPGKTANEQANKWSGYRLRRTLDKA